ncbi:hypothetical protein EC973_006823 [Apophysomyces ossiformis]|uniref:Uncharacterized protein n=1 Tax=Apophysomyces ossiformis TaxID=679940 RepID=A0A8H7BQH6_9FUNG|nr:hypothetical protein EC973_006823 [Apophysomyces ossiformis]
MPKFLQKVIAKLEPIVTINNLLLSQDMPLKTLSTSFPNVHTLLLADLDKDMDTLPVWLWSQQTFVNLGPSATKLWNTIVNHQACCRENIMNERGGFVVWFLASKPLAIEQAFSALIRFAVGKGRPRYADGLGYDKDGEERLIMEASGGQHHEDIQKTIGDSIKQLSSMISMLKH